MSVNKVILIGRVGKDPDARHLDGDKTVASFSLATSEKYTNRAGEKVEQTEWHNVVIWGKLAEIAEKYVVKGMMLYIEGKIKTRSWEKDGVKHYTTEIFADSFQMLSSKPDNQAPARDQYTTSGTPVSTFESERPDGEDDLPF